MAPEHKLRVIAPDVGGGFGSKIFIYPEEVVCLWAAKKVGRPVKWMAERSESFLADAHGRDHVTHAEMALDADGKITALRVKTIANIGAYMSTFSSSVPTYLYATLLSGQYDIPHIYCEVDAVYTNTAPVDAYRGAGRPEATFVIERLIEVSARQLGSRPAELRRKNFIGKFPHQTPVIMNYDAGDYDASLKKALELADFKQFRQAQARIRAPRQAARPRLLDLYRGLRHRAEPGGRLARRRRRLVGIGRGAGQPDRQRRGPDRHATATARATRRPSRSSSPSGSASRSTNVVDRPRRHRQGAVRHGHLRLALGRGRHVGDRRRRSTRSRPRRKKVASHLLEAAEADIVFKDGRFTVAGTDKSAAWGEVALHAYIAHKFAGAELEPGLKEGAFYDPTNFTFPAGCHICEVEIDPETGVTRIANWVAVDDFGVVINPMIVEGQVHGGIAQGVGQALLERTVYDGSGQLVTGSLMDYTMPRADNLPSFTVGTTVTKCPSNPLGIKGCGEAGAIAAPAAVMNAITDAIGSEDIAMPATPQAVWAAIRKANAAQPAK